MALPLKNQLEQLSTKIDSLQDVVSEILLMIAGEQPPVIEPVIEIDYGLPDLKDARLYWHFNGVPPPKNRTSYGLVLDNNNSKQRFYYNFEVVSHSRFVQLLNDPTISESEKLCISATIDLYKSIQPGQTQKVLMCGAKENLTPGNGYKLERNCNTCAVVVIEDNQPTFTTIIFGDRPISIKPSDWRFVKGFSYQGIVYLDGVLAKL